MNRVPTLFQKLLQLQDLKVHGLFQDVGDLTQPAGLPVTLQHPKINPFLDGAVNKALPIRRTAEADARKRVTYVG